MNGPDSSPSAAAAPRADSERPPILVGLIALLCFALLTVTTVFGSIAVNQRTSAHTRARVMHEIELADTAGIDLFALRRGRAEYLNSCTACHGPNGEALPNLGKDLRHSEFIGKQSDGQMLMFLKLGRSTWDPANTTGIEMPGKGGNPMLTDAHLADIVQYLRYLQADAGQ